MGKLGRIGKIRTAGCQKALRFYVLNHTPISSNYALRCQIGGEWMDPRDLTPAHKIGRPHIKAGWEEGEGEHPSNIWAACWPHHREVDLRPLLKKELMKQKISCLDGGVLILTAEQKKEIGVK